MSTYSDSEGDQFFDNRNEDCVPDFDPESDNCSTSGVTNWVTNNFGYDFWVGNMESVDQRRDKFLRWMDSDSEWHSNGREDPGDAYFNEINRCIDRSGENNDPLVVNKYNDVGSSSNETPSSGVDDKAVDNNDDTKLVRDNPFRNELVEKLSVLNVGQFAMDEELHGLSELDSETITLLDRRKKVKSGWLQKLSVLAKIVDKQEEAISKAGGANSRIVRVHAHAKHSKEVSSLHAGQDFLAHKGSILTMKFSHDGHYLATGSEDGIICLWEVVESERRNDIESHGNDPSCIYFSANRYSELAPLYVEDKGKIRKMRKSSESACVIIPHKVFQILEKPVHEFRGHAGEILSLSWSKQGHLLSSSDDKTARLWQVGENQCLKVFSHTDYVTSVEFNPMDDNYFISGSIDGKVRMWEVNGCQVIDWIDVKEIVTAVCYRPDGKGIIVGTMDGNCIFYDIMDDRLELDSQICLAGKKKLPGKRITGLEFCPSDLSKLMVTSADSKVVVLNGCNILCKYKGGRSTGSQMSASFTADGKHIISTAEDSNIYVWNNISSAKMPTKPKNILSYENFLSQNASIAIPWCGMQRAAAQLPSPSFLSNDHSKSPRRNGNFPKMPIFYPGGVFFETLCKGSPTWPAESLPDSSKLSTSPPLHKAEYKFLKSAYQSASVSPHLWGLVIVTAGWDGRIKTFLNYGLPVRL